MTRCAAALFMALAVTAPVPAGAATPLDVKTEIDTDDWYPLPDEQMRTIVTDAALDAVTESYRFALTRGSGPNDEESAQLVARITLVGPERVVKLGLRLDAPGQPTLVATSSMVVEGIGHKGFFRAFDYVGRQAGTEITDRLVARLEADDAEPGGRDADETLVARFNRGKELKRGGKFKESRKAFVAVTEMADESHQDWAEMARDELEYGLLVTEAKQLMAQMGGFDTSIVEKEALARDAGHRLRQALAQNRTHAKRNGEVQRLLDQVDMTLRHLAKAKESQAIARVGAFRTIMTEHYVRHGGCPDTEQTRQLLDRQRGKIELEGISGSEKDRTYTFYHERTEVHVDLRCHSGEIELLGTQS